MIQRDTAPQPDATPEADRIAACLNGGTAHDLTDYNTRAECGRTVPAGLCAEWRRLVDDGMTSGTLQKWGRGAPRTVRHHAHEHCGHDGGGA